jgi:hypothetical protein
MRELAMMVWFKKSVLHLSKKTHKIHEALGIFRSVVSNSTGNSMTAV